MLIYVDRGARILYSLSVLTQVTNETGLVVSAQTAWIPTTNAEIARMRREFRANGWELSDVANKRVGHAVRGNLETGRTRIDWVASTRHNPARWEFIYSTLTPAGRAAKGLS